MNDLPTTAEIEEKPPVEKTVDSPPTKTIDNQAKKIVRRKKKSTDPKPPVDSSQGELAESSSPSELKNWVEPTTTKTVVEGTIEFTVPFCLDKNVRPRRRFLTALRDLTAKQRFGLNVLLEGMKSNGTKIENGSVVNSHVNAIRSLLEMVADSASKEIEK